MNLSRQWVFWEATATFYRRISKVNEKCIWSGFMSLDDKTFVPLNAGIKETCCSLTWAFLKPPEIHPHLHDKLWPVPLSSLLLCGCALRNDPHVVPDMNVVSMIFTHIFCHFKSSNTTVLVYIKALIYWCLKVKKKQYCNVQGVKNFLTEVRVKGCHSSWEMLGQCKKIYCPGRAKNPFLFICSSNTRDGWLMTYEMKPK